MADPFEFADDAVEVDDISLFIGSLSADEDAKGRGDCDEDQLAKELVVQRHTEEQRGCNTGGQSRRYLT